MPAKKTNETSENFVSTNNDPAVFSYTGPVTASPITPGSSVWDSLHAPLPQEAVTPHPTKKFLSNIKTIFITERFNEVFGVNGWYSEAELVIQEGKMVVVLVKFYADAYGIYRESYGGNDNADLGDAYKGAVTDALSKIASMIGIATEVYKGLRTNQPSTTDVVVPTMQADGRQWITETQFNNTLDLINKAPNKEEKLTILSKAKEHFQISSVKLTKLEAAIA